MILLRRAAIGFEVLLLRRRAGASFMAQAYVFPGGAQRGPSEDARTAAVRELFEESGILLARDADRDTADTLEAPSQDSLRAKLLAGEPAERVLARCGARRGGPSMRSCRGRTGSRHRAYATMKKPKRFSARFFVIELPRRRSGAELRRAGDRRSRVGRRRTAC